MTDLSAKFSDAAADITPAAIPDLYRDEPLVLAAKLDKLAGSVEIKGRIGDRPGSSRCRSPMPPKARACRNYGRAARSRTPKSRAPCSRPSPEDADKAILALALEHQLVTRLTSLVAVDKTPSRPEGEPLKLARTADQPAGGLGFCKGVRRTPAAAGNADGAARRARRSPGSGRGAEDARSLRRARRGTVKLPKTATDAELKMIAGSILLMFSLILFVFNRRQALLR